MIVERFHYDFYIFPGTVQKHGEKAFPRSRFASLWQNEDDDEEIVLAGSV